MFLLGVALYFILACLISWLALFPAGREFVMHWMSRAESRISRGFSQLARRREHGVQVLRLSGISALHGVAGFFRRHYLLCLAGGAVICLPPVLALMASNKSMLGGYDVSTREMNQQVSGLLQGEQLVPPVELPPLVFATAEVAQLRPMLVSASRNWTLLNQDYAQRLLLVFKIMKEKHGYDMAILEGYRSPERQNLLASMGSNVTNAAAFQSWHQYGLAADCAFLRDGKLVISEKDPWAMRGYQLYGEVAESVGMTWGGRWKMMDFGHTELRLPGVMKR
ncbi:M15 family metallopeptidase [Janthinobacterium agaricidamnosum]|uniref:D-alanyl-D-alanine carboxypeptidase family protein n=1 Tax=Janthinobacterium agaricidamnosum NBRC 102515 = DSM 9628 TaxID=1349767 RepID=W0V2W5_9BURK|nr:M15 family metallopeptidase [Janthinobacterium agaricidamnosum]CDG83174.1 D-alanyl-D-alanine carboxypeptidase family protein [Janthinobacterium agaricidamnosum NBRC 102515 = DSM 9628]